MRSPGALGTWCQLPSPFAGEILARAGYDWVLADLQHGAGNVETAAAVVQSISVGGALPLVRVPWNEGWLIGRALDIGAAGVVVPLVNSAAEAERAAAACRYAPAGTRSFGPLRLPPAIEGGVLCIVMVETREAVERVEEICAVPGVDGVFIGPSDLALSHGLEGPGPETEPAIARVLDACRRAGIAAGLHCPSGEAAKARLAQGFSFAAVSGDLDLLLQAAQRELAAALGEPPSRPGGPEGIVRVAL